MCTGVLLNAWLWMRFKTLRNILFLGKKCSIGLLLFVYIPMVWFIFYTLFEQFVFFRFNVLSVFITYNVYQV